MAPQKHAIICTCLTLGSILFVFCSTLSIVSGAYVCEELPVHKCAFAVSSTGHRCMLEKNMRRDGTSEYKCQTSPIMADTPRELIESEHCIRSCGLERLSVGFSTDALLEHDFVRKLCLSHCRTSCPNIDDLYTKLAAGEGIHLDTMCSAVKERMSQLVDSQARARHSSDDASATTRGLTDQALAPAIPSPAPTCTVTCREPPLVEPQSPSSPISRRPNEAEPSSTTSGPVVPSPAYKWPLAASPTPHHFAEDLPTGGPTRAAEPPELPATPPAVSPPLTPPSPPPSLPPPSLPPPPPPPAPPPPPLPFLPNPVPDIFHGLFPGRRRFPPANV